MGEWEIYCAICGGPVGNVDVAEEQRPVEFQRRVEEALARRKVQNIPVDEEMFELEIEKWEEAPGGAENDISLYDPDILSKQDIAWCQIIHAVALRDYDNIGFKR
jgi:hypothetical protein